MLDEATVSSAWVQAELTAALVAVDPWGVGGAVVQTRRGPVHDLWLNRLRALMVGHGPIVPVPATVSADRLLGDIDVAATLVAGRIVETDGLLAKADGGVLMIGDVHQIEPAVERALAGVLDHGEASREAGGLKGLVQTRAGVVAFDEGGERVGLAGLFDRLALRVHLSNLSFREAAGAMIGPEMVAAARARLADVRVDDDVVGKLCGTAIALGIVSGRAERLALSVARALAALSGRMVVSQGDATRAAQLVLGPRARQVPEAEGRDDEVEGAGRDDPADAQPPNPGDADERNQESRRERSLSETPQEVIVEAVAIDADIAALMAGRALDVMRRRPAAAEGGRRAGRRIGRARGKPVGVRRPRSLREGRLNITATLRAAVPWQRIRRGVGHEGGGADDADARHIIVHPDDLRVARFREQEAQTIIFLVDASGSTALARLAEAKGAVELLLGESYRRRDEVALVGFRGERAQVLLAPTRSLVRAKRQLARLPGGGGTPLASGLMAGLQVGLGVEACGRRPVFVVMTDGRANIDLSGTAHRGQAREDAIKAARLVHARQWQCLFLDVSPRRRGGGAEDVAHALGARYAFLPGPTSRQVADSVRESLLSRTTVS